MGFPCIELLLLLPAAASDPALERIRAGHIQSRESIQSISVRIEVVASNIGPKSRPPVRTVAELWQLGENYRSREESKQDLGATDPFPDRRVDRMFRDGTFRTLLLESLKSGGPPPSGSIGKQAGAVSPFLPWSWGNFSLKVGVPFGEALSDEDKYVERSEEDQVNGRRTHRVDFKRDGQIVVKAWFDPAVNFLVSRMEINNVETGTKHSREILEFREIKPGVFFPLRAISRHTLDGQPTNEVTYTITQIQINEPIAESNLVFRFPKGAVITDETKGIVYVVDKDETPDSSITPRSLPPRTNESIQYATGQAPEQPRSWNRTVALALLVIASGGTVVALAFKNRRKRSLDGAEQ